MHHSLNISKVFSNSQEKSSLFFLLTVPELSESTKTLHTLIGIKIYVLKNVILIHRPPSDLENVQEIREHKKEIALSETISLPNNIPLNSNADMRADLQEYCSWHTEEMITVLMS